MWEGEIRRWSERYTTQVTARPIGKRIDDLNVKQYAEFIIGYSPVKKWS